MAELFPEIYDSFLGTHSLIKFPDMETIFYLLSGDDKLHGSGKVKVWTEPNGHIVTTFPDRCSRTYWPERNTYYWSKADKSPGRCSNKFPHAMFLPGNMVGLHKPNTELKDRSKVVFWSIHYLPCDEERFPTVIRNDMVEWGNQDLDFSSPRYPRSGALVATEVRSDKISWENLGSTNEYGPYWLEKKWVNGCQVELKYTYVIDSLIADSKLFAMRYEMVYLREFVEPDPKLVLLDVREEIDNLNYRRQ